MKDIPLSVDFNSELLNRSQATALLASAGYKISATTLNRLGRDGGPDYFRLGRSILYEKKALLAWARERLTTGGIRK